MGLDMGSDKAFDMAFITLTCVGVEDMFDWKYTLFRSAHWKVDLC